MEETKLLDECAGITGAQPQAGAGAGIAGAQPQAGAGAGVAGAQPQPSEAGAGIGAAQEGLQSCRGWMGFGLHCVSKLGLKA